MKNVPGTLYEAFTMAQDMEKILSEPKRQGAFVSVQAVDVQESEEDLMLELAAVQTRVQNFRGRGQTRGRGGRGRGGRGGGGGQAQGGQAQSGDYNKCRFCTLFGHIQKFCHKRIAAGAPMVDKAGKPYPARVSELSAQGGEQQNNQAPPQQMQGNGNGMAPGAMQNQGAPGYFQHPTPGYYGPAQGAPGFFMPPDFQS